MFNDNGSFLLALFEFFLFFAWFMCLFWVFGDIFRSKDLGGGGKTVWVLFVIVLPLLGMLVYLIARGKGMATRQQASVQKARAETETYIKTVAGKSPAANIAEAKALLDAGTISADEFAKLKAKALG